MPTGPATTRNYEECRSACPSPPGHRPDQRPGHGHAPDGADRRLHAAKPSVARNQVVGRPRFIGDFDRRHRLRIHRLDLVAVAGCLIRRMNVR